MIKLAVYPVLIATYILMARLYVSTYITNMVSPYAIVPLL